MILRKLIRLLLRRLVRHIYRRAVNRLLYYCQRADWPEKELCSVCRTLIILLRLLMEKFMPPGAAKSSCPHKALGCPVQ
jgi:hypothetical protein